MYSVFTVKFCPEEMLYKYPTPSTFAQGSLYLFGESFKEVTDRDSDIIIDISKLGFNHPFHDDDSGLTNTELDVLIDELIAISGEGEVILSPSQGEYLYDTRFGKEHIIDDGI